MNVLTPRKGLKWKAEATAAIIKLMASDAYREPLSSPHCGDWTPPGLVTRRFHFKGKGRDLTLDVTLHAKMMVGLLKAMRACPSIQVAGPLASYRSYETQYHLWYAWTHHLPGSHLAANPCYGYHRCGRACDLYNVTAAERKAMLAVRVKAGKGSLRLYDLLPQDPPHFTLGVRG
jgi:hypothetical protein